MVEESIIVTGDVLEVYVCKRDQSYMNLVCF